MILNNEQQKRFIYFSTLGLLVLIGIPLIVYMAKYIDFADMQNNVIAVLVLGLAFLLLHQLLIHVISKISIKNQLRQEDIRFAAFLIYTKIQGVKFTLTKHTNSNDDCYHLNYKSEVVRYVHIRKRILFALLAIEKTPNVILSAELRKKFQDEWTEHLEDRLSFEEAFLLWKKEVEEVSPLVTKHLKSIKKLSNILSVNPDIKSILKLLDNI
ncbi:hypothetical protein HCY52_08190 [Acinetobacter radioresistens]|uniref:hypothetical protein n=1 Tax=Acinetobacter radioresistens TaxID=40216 RepID=UPI0020065DFB|nr:hypothetical protein [Acinetobacter radioresistens]MCK4083794.1 hypothetical protein [Acinetobacter radioresistens]